MIAALLMRMSMPPKASTATFAIAFADSAERTSTAVAAAEWPSATSSAAVFSAASALRSATTTDAPASQRARA